MSVTIEFVGGPLCGITRAVQMDDPPTHWREQVAAERWAGQSNSELPDSAWKVLAYRRVRAKPGGILVYEYDPTASK